MSREFIIKKCVINNPRESFKNMSVFYTNSSLKDSKNSTKNEHKFTDRDLIKDIIDRRLIKNQEVKYASLSNEETLMLTEAPTDELLILISCKLRSTDK
jgi:hypothetical protein